MEKLRTPLLVTAIYILVLGFLTLSPSMVRAVFGFTTNDRGVLLILSAAFWASGVVLAGIARDPEKHGDLAWTVMVYLVIFIVFLLWGRVERLYSIRHLAIPLVIDAGLVVWIWFARKGGGSPSR